MKCPTCKSPDPKRHPAMQFEGEVELCDDSFHSPNAQQIRDEWRNKPARNEIERASGRRFGE